MCIVCYKDYFYVHVLSVIWCWLFFSLRVYIVTRCRIGFNANWRNISLETSGYFYFLFSMSENPLPTWFMVKKNINICLHFPHVCVSRLHRLRHLDGLLPCGLHQESGNVAEDCCIYGFLHRSHLMHVLLLGVPHSVLSLISDVTHL